LPNLEEYIMVENIIETLLRTINALLSDILPARPLAAFGLILGIIGVLMIFKWGPPQPSFQEGVHLSIAPRTPMPDGRTAEEHVDDARRQRSKCNRMSKTGLGLILIGFIFQLVDAWRN
jgi:hypothetical protein